MKNLVILVCILYSSNSLCQENRTKPDLYYAWINGGLKLVPNLCFKTDFDLEYKRNLFTASYHDNSQFSLLPDLFEKECNERRYYYSVIYGYTYRHGNTISSISAGPSYVNIVFCDLVETIPTMFFPDKIYKTRSEYAFGLFLKAQSILHGDYSGVGLSIEANLNKLKSYIGFGVNISLGKFN